MTEETQKSESPSRLDSKMWRVVLVLLTAFLTFGGPYVVYALFHLFKISYVISFGSALGMFIIGLVLVRYLIKNKIIP